LRSWITIFQWVRPADSDSHAAATVAYVLQRLSRSNQKGIDMKTLTIASLAAAGMLTLAACDNSADGTTESAAAQPPPVSFDAADANHDGRITVQEALEVPGLNFDRMDTDKNMAVTQQEFANAVALARPRG
jgi:hypothetical protein